MKKLALALLLFTSCNNINTQNHVKVYRVLVPSCVSNSGNQEIDTYKYVIKEGIIYFVNKDTGDSIISKNFSIEF